MQSKAKTVAAYLQTLPPDRRVAIAAVRKVILKNLPKGFEETMNWGGICYEVPLSCFPKTYNGQPLVLAGLASQKNYMAVYLMCAYLDKATHAQFRKEYLATGKKLDMGKCCVRFKKLEDLPLNLIGKVIARVSVDEYVERYKKLRHSEK